MERFSISLHVFLSSYVYNVVIYSFLKNSFETFDYGGIFDIAFGVEIHTLNGSTSAYLHLV